MATLNGRSQPNGIIILVGGAKGHHSNTKMGGANAMEAVPLWAGLRVTMATLRWAEPSPIGDSIPGGGAKGCYGNIKGAEPTQCHQHPGGRG